MGEIEFKAKECPGPGYYKYDPNMLLKRSSCIKFTKNKKDKISRPKKDLSPSPHSYEVMKPKD